MFVTIFVGRLKRSFYLPLSFIVYQSSTQLASPDLPICNTTYVLYQTCKIPNPVPRDSGFFQSRIPRDFGHGISGISGTNLATKIRTNCVKLLKNHLKSKWRYWILKLIWQNLKKYYCYNNVQEALESGFNSKSSFLLSLQGLFSFYDKWHA